VALLFMLPGTAETLRVIHPHERMRVVAGQRLAR
jgi:hypothetical protein